MKSVTLQAVKANVMGEVEKTTSYAGRKIDQAATPVEGQETAYERVRTTPATEELLTRFFDEAASFATSRMMRFISSTTTNSTSYTANLSLTDRFDEALVPYINESLFSYFVSFILSRWFKISNKQEAETYMADANAMLDDVMRKIYFRSAPTREN